MIASHYAEPLDGVLSGLATLREAPSEDSAAVMKLKPGDPFAMLDDSLGWAWGYGGKKRRVGYVRSEAVRPA